MILPVVPSQIRAVVSRDPVFYPAAVCAEARGIHCIFMPAKDCDNCAGFRTPKSRGFVFRRSDDPAAVWTKCGRPNSILMTVGSPLRVIEGSCKSTGFGIKQLRDLIFGSCQNPLPVRTEGCRSNALLMPHYSAS